MIEKCKQMTRSFIAGSWFVPSLCLLSAVSMCAGLNLGGGMALAAVAVWLMLFSDDTLAVLFPVMFTVMTLTSFYNNYYELMRYAWVTVPFAAALAVHIIAYRGPFVRGRFFFSLAGVSIALITGGIGVISLQEYFSGVSVYYILGLGAGLLLVYMLMCSRLSRPRDYDIVERFAGLLYGMALLAALIILLYYARHWESLLPDFKTPFISYRNFCTTVMLFGLPMCCLFIRKNHLHLLGMAFIYFVMLVGGSRSALFFGTVELVMCIGYIYIRYPEKRAGYRRIAMFCALPAALVIAYLIHTFFTGDSGRFSQYFIRPTEARPSLYRQGVLDFLAEPVLGYGIGNMKNAGIYQGVNGSINFYHNSVLQVMGSLGAVGCAAYLYQFWERIRLLWQKRHKDAFLMSISFAGILLISQTNPGLFCPLPTALLLVVMFAVVEFENSAAEPAALPIINQSVKTAKSVPAAVTAGN